MDEAEFDKQALAELMEEVAVKELPEGDTDARTDLIMHDSIEFGLIPEVTMRKIIKDK